MHVEVNQRTVPIRYQYINVKQDIPVKGKKTIPCFWLTTDFLITCDLIPLFHPTKRNGRSLDGTMNYL